jgi:hypothetical protein
MCTVRVEVFSCCLKVGVVKLKKDPQEMVLIGVGMKWLCYMYWIPFSFSPLSLHDMRTHTHTHIFHDSSKQILHSIHLHDGKALRTANSSELVFRTFYTYHLPQISQGTNYLHSEYDPTHFAGCCTQVSLLKSSRVISPSLFAPRAPLPSARGILELNFKTMYGCLRLSACAQTNCMQIRAGSHTTV